MCVWGSKQYISGPCGEFPRGRCFTQHRSLLPREGTLLRFNICGPPPHPENGQAVWAIGSIGWALGPPVIKVDAGVFVCASKCPCQTPRRQE